MGITTLIGSAHTASNAASIDITSGIDSTYDEYMFVLTNISPATNGADFTFQCNVAGASGFNEAMVSSYHHAEHDESDGTANGPSMANENDQIASDVAYQILHRSAGSGSDEDGAGILNLFTPSNTTYVTHWHYRGQHYHSSDYSIDSFIGGQFQATGAIDEISFKMSSGNLDGVIQMYGIA